MYNSTTITILVLLGFVAILLLAYIFFERQTKNFFISILGKYRKRYVICHMNYQAGLKDLFKVVPNSQGLTKVGNYSYDLSEKYAILSYKKRLHFSLNENDTIPQTIKEQTDDQIIFKAAEIQTALDNTVMEYLFSKRKEMLIAGLFIIGIIAVLAIIYNIYSIKQMQEAITTIPRVIKP